MADAVWICRTCGVEHSEPIALCAICADERQWVPQEGQSWTTLEELSAGGHRVRVRELEPDLFGITVDPIVGIGQQSFCVRTPEGVLLWDPVGFVDAQAVERIGALGPVLAIAASHPHMFGAQVAWSEALGGAPVLVAESDLGWVARPSASIVGWGGTRTLAPGLTLHQLGGHFPGSAVVHWSGGAGGEGVLLLSDTIHINPDRRTTTFMRSYPNRIPLSAAVVQRMAAAVAPLGFDRAYDNFGKSISAGAAAAVADSAARYVSWARGDFDGLT